MDDPIISWPTIESIFSGLALLTMGPPEREGGGSAMAKAILAQIRGEVGSRPSIAELNDRLYEFKGIATAILGEMGYDLAPK